MLHVIALKVSSALFTLLLYTTTYKGIVMSVFLPHVLFLRPFNGFVEDCFVKITLRVVYEFHIGLFYVLYEAHVENYFVSNMEHHTKITDTGHKIRIMFYL